MILFYDPFYQLSLYPNLCNLGRIEIQLRFQKHIDPLLGFESNKVAFFQQDELSTKKKVGAIAAQNERDLLPIWHRIYIRTGSSWSLMSALHDFFEPSLWAVLVEQHVPYIQFLPQTNQERFKFTTAKE